MWRNALGALLGTTPRGEDWELRNGGEEKGPQMQCAEGKLLREFLGNNVLMG